MERARLTELPTVSPVNDVNENLDDSLEAKEIGGYNAQEEEPISDDDQDIVGAEELAEKEKPIRGKNNVYELLEVFDDIEKYEEFWNQSKFHQLYCVQERAANSSGRI